jgi:prepilin-type processing-associated H-X9-DG protein
MTDSTHQQLLGHLLDALDDDEQRWLDARLEYDEERRLELARWRRRLAPLEALRPDFEPPPWLAEWTCRLVAAFGSPPPPTVRPRVGMTPQPIAPSRMPQIGWRDVTAVGLVLLTALALLLPAINNSRFYARLTSCQDGLRQIGLALTEYSHRDGDPLPRLAAGGRLTGAGVYAAGLLRNQLASDAGRRLCPDVWLAVQEEPAHAFSRSLRVAVRQLGPQWLRGPQSADIDPIDLSNGWPGTRRDGTTGGLGNLSPAAQALLADAPSVDLPGQTIASHGGRGRNVFFADGHVEFVPCTVTWDASQAFLP